MPNYDYLCETCGPFTGFAPMSDYDRPAACPVCGSPSRRAFFTPPQLATSSGAVRHMHETNERARHEPKHAHGAGCGCCAGGAKGKASQHRADGSVSFPGKRPWMISH